MLLLLKGNLVCQIILSTLERGHLVEGGKYQMQPV